MYENESTKIRVTKLMSLFLSMCLLVCQKEHCSDGWYPY